MYAKEHCCYEMTISCNAWNQDRDKWFVIDPEKGFPCRWHAGDYLFYSPLYIAEARKQDGVVSQSNGHQGMRITGTPHKQSSVNQTPHDLLGPKGPLTWATLATANMSPLSCCAFLAAVSIVPAMSIASDSDRLGSVSNLFCVVSLCSPQTKWSLSASSQ